MERGCPPRERRKCQRDEQIQEQRNQQRRSLAEDQPKSAQKRQRRGGLTDDEQRCRQCPVVRRDKGDQPGEEDGLGHEVIAVVVEQELARQEWTAYSAAHQGEAAPVAVNV